MQTNYFMSGGDPIPNLTLPENSLAPVPNYVSGEPSNIIPTNLNQVATYPLYYSTLYSPPLQVGAGPKKGKTPKVRGRWKSVSSPRP